MLLALGICAALVETAESGKGQVVDAAMTDGSALLATMVHSFAAMGIWGKRGTNMLDTGAPFYDVYECADGEYISLGSIEPQFYSELMRITGLENEDMPSQMDRTNWGQAKKMLKEKIRSKSREEWVQLMEGSDVCFAPVLSIDEAIQHPHNRERETFVEISGVMQPAPAPRFSRTPSEISSPPPHPGQQTDQILSQQGFSKEEIDSLKENKVVK